MRHLVLHKSLTLKLIVRAQPNKTPPAACRKARISSHAKDHCITPIQSQNPSHTSRTLQSALHMPNSLPALTDHGAHAVLCCAHRTGTLSTVASDGPAAGFPSGSVVEYAPDENGRPVFMISSISPHTKHLKKDSRCSFTVLAPAFRVRAPPC